MNRRGFIKGALSGGIFLNVTTFSKPARAIIPFALAEVLLNNIFITVALRRYASRALERLLIKLLPRFFRSELAKYLTAVGLNFKLNEAQARVAASNAENAGAIDIARNSYTRSVDVTIENMSDSVFEISHVYLVLVDTESRTIDLTPSRKWGLVIYPRSTIKQVIVSSNYPLPGIKQWYLLYENGTLAKSEKFLVVA